MVFRLLLCLIMVVVAAGCEDPADEAGVDGETPEAITPAETLLQREDVIPADAVKIVPETDMHPPILHSDEWNEPVPVGAPINTAGAEDSPFIMPDGNTLYFFFTPDTSVPAEKQLLDGVTGIYAAKKHNGIWGNVERVMLQDDGKLALDGCAFVQNDMIWFCSAREGYTGLHWVTASYQDDEWQNWEVSDFPAEYEVGELHFSTDGARVYFHSSRGGGKGGYDIWMSKTAGGQWMEPENIGAVNSSETEGWPYLNQDGNELWFLRTYMGTPAVYRSKLVEGNWSQGELIISQFAGEPSLDNEGNIYFVHHFFKDGVMLEADIYAAYRK